MNIIEATRKAMEVNGFMRRRSRMMLWKSKIQPTNTSDCCSIFYDGETAPRWNPTADDLLADDWEVVA